MCELLVLDRNTWNHTNLCKQMTNKKVQFMKTDAMKHLKYSYDYCQIFTNKSNFDIELPVRNWYAFIQINQTKTSISFKCVSLKITTKDFRNNFFLIN